MDAARVRELAESLKIGLSDDDAATIADALQRRIEELSPLEAVDGEDVDDGTPTDPLPPHRELCRDELAVSPAELAPTAAGGFITFPRPV